jgi:hypothetical protein
MSEHAAEDLHLEVYDGHVVLIYITAYINCICNTSSCIIYTAVKNDSWTVCKNLLISILRKNPTN